MIARSRNPFLPLERESKPLTFNNFLSGEFYYTHNSRWMFIGFSALGQIIVLRYRRPLYVRDVDTGAR